ncbi:MAG: hypothetical protein LBT12_01540 [Oscillospiraceae bacterium]|jgi:hypothetical protein|nr:hypothetical protein [Oscillospiraceae bacterium]
MAKIGANHPCFLKEGAEEGIVLGKLVAANETLNFAKADLYADDALTEQYNAFTDGALAVEQDDMTNEVSAALFGATLDEDGELSNNTADDPPLGSFSYYKAGMRNKARYYQGVYYPQVQAVVSGTNAQTKGSSMSFQTTSFTLTIFADETGEYRKFSDTFETEAEARAWVDEKCAIETVPAG